MPTRRKEINPGLKVNKLTVVREGKSNKTGVYWICRCDCGVELEVSASQLNSANKRVIKTCGCERHLSKITGTKNISGTYYGHIKSSAKHRQIEFSITIEYLQKLWDKQNGKCYLSGIPIHLNLGKKYNWQSASLDRIDSSKGYIEGNVQWLHRDVNFAKHKKSCEDFIDLCETIIDYQKSTGFLEDR